MSLTTQGINNARTIINSIGKAINEPKEDTLKIVDYVMSNEEFRKFTEGTERGKTTLNAWKNVLEDINDICEQLNTLKLTTLDYIEEQEILNNRKI